jgi:ABC-type antimicrobial peptide transport system permease subunit
MKEKIYTIIGGSLIGGVLGFVLGFVFHFALEMAHFSDEQTPQLERIYNAAPMTYWVCTILGILIAGTWTALKKNKPPRT